MQTLNFTNLNDNSLRGARKKDRSLVVRSRIARFSIQLMFVASLLFGLASPSLAQESCDTEGDVTIAYKGIMCALVPYTIELNGTVAEGPGDGCVMIAASTPKTFTKLKLNKTYRMKARQAICITTINFQVPEGYTLFIDGQESNQIFKSDAIGSAFSGDGEWDIVVRRKCDCGPNEIGNAASRRGSVAWQSGMGMLTDGRSAFGLSLSEEALSTSIYTPSALVYSAPGFTTEVDVVTSGGSLRQVKAPQGLADIVVVNASEYDVRYYRPADVGAKTNGIYAVSGQPFVTWKFKNPDPSSTTKLLIQKIENGSVVDQNEYLWEPITDAWTLSTGWTPGAGTYSRIESSTVSRPGTNLRSVISTVKDNTGKVASKTARTYKNFPWGEELVQEIEDPEVSALTTTYDFYANHADESSYGQRKSLILPDGSWEKYEYNDVDWTISRILRPWKGLTLETATAQNSRATLYQYARHDGFKLYAYYKFVTGIQEQIQGVVVSNKTFTRWSAVNGVPITVNGQPVVLEEERDYASASLSQATTTTRYYHTATSFLVNRIADVEHPDGRKDTYTYEKGNHVPNIDPSLSQFTPNANGLAERATIIHGTTTSPNGVAFKTTKDVIVRDQRGNEVLQETHVFNGTDYERIAWTAMDYDDRAHLVTSRNHKGELTTAVWTGDKKISETASSGIETSYTYDSLNKIKTQTKKGVAAGGGFPAQGDIVTTFSYDAEGRPTSEVVTGAGLSLTTSRVFDKVGRLAKETDQAGLSTTYSYANGGRTQTVVRPGGATQITDHYLDGQTKSITGSAVVAQAFDYGVNADGSRFTQEFAGSAGLNSPRWTKTTIDWIDRPIFVTKPAFSGPDVIQATVYNNKGQKQSESVSAGATKLVADKLFEYDELGNEIRSGSDIDASGSLTLASTDRVKETNVSYQKVGSDWLLVTTWRDFLIDNDDTPTTQTRAERLNNFTINGTEQTISETNVTDLTGNNTKTITTLDRAAKRITDITDTPDSNLNSISVTVNGLLQSTSANTPQLPTTYTYDALGRQTSVTDPRKGTSTGIYSNTTGQLLSTSDGFGTTSYEYYPGSHVSAGRLKSQTNPEGKKVFFNYSPRGEMIQTWGDTTYPIEYLFDPYGQMAEMHTFRNGKGWTSSSWPTATTGAADITRFIYQDTTGLLLQKQDAVGKAIVYTYDEMGRVKTRTWARGVTSTYSYDANTGHPTGVSYSDSTPATTLAYDRVGRKKTITDAAGVHARTFTANGQLQTEQITTGILDSINVNIGYDSSVRRNSLQSSSGANVLSSQTFGYDLSSRLQTITSGSQTATYAYHPNSGLLNTTTFGSGTVTSRSYDTRGRLETISTSTPAAGVVASHTYTYNNLHQRTRVTREDGSYWAYIYNDRGELADARKYWADNAPVWGAQTEYKFDDVGNRISAKSGGNQLNQTRVSNFTTNSLNQYVQRTVPGALDITGTANSSAAVTVNNQSTVRKGDYFYKELAVNNADGPVNQNVSVTGAQQNFGAGGEDAVTEQGGNVLVPQGVEALTYDFDGNLTSDSRFNYAWDAENRLVSVESSVNVPAAAKKRLEFAYDYMSRRVQKKVFSWDPGTSSYQLQSTIRYVYDDWNLIVELNEVNSPIKSYVWGQDLSGTLTDAGGIGGLLLINDSGNIHQTGADGNGNIAIVISAASGLPSATYEYDAFGNTIRATGSYANSNTIRFSSKYVDLETGLIYFGYRYYDPSTGRFINRDPLWENDGPNILTIVGNDPIDFVDPLGLSKLGRDEGAVALRAGLPMLQRACDRGCTPGSCCKPRGCKLESATLVELLVQAWLRNHGRGPYDSSIPGSDTVGGYFCWDWALIFEDAAASRPFQCLGIKMGMALGPQDPRNYSTYAVHYYLKVWACKKEEARYQVTFDDGFFDGTNAAHEGYFPRLGGSYMDEIPPWPVSRPAPFDRTPRPPTRP